LKVEFWLAEDAAGGLGSRIEDLCFSSISGASLQHFN